jgi:hypothetical protein
VYASTALTALWFKHSQMKPRFHHLLLIKLKLRGFLVRKRIIPTYDWEIHHHHCVITLKRSLCFVHTHEHYQSPSCTKLEIAEPNCDNLIKNCHEICGNSRSYETVSAVFHKFFSQLFGQDDHSLQIDNHFTLHYERSQSFVRPPIFEHSTLLSYSSFPHYILAINRA